MKKISSLTFSLVLFLFVSCSHHLHVESGECAKDSLWSDEIGAGEKIDFKHWSFSSLKSFDTLNLEDVFKQKKIDCKNLERLSLMVKKTNLDFIFSLIPFAERKTLVFYYQKKQFMEENKNLRNESLPSQ